MKNLLKHIQSRVSVTQNEIDLINKFFISEKVPAKTTLLKAGKVERYIYFLSNGVVKGYQNIDGKIVIQHLVSAQNFFTSLDSFLNEAPSLYYYETILECSVIKISKQDFDLLQNETTFWGNLINIVTNEHVRCKLDRVKDFQVLTAKERYIKFANQHPDLILNVSVDNIASFLGIEPQSLSRIRKQITF